MSESTITYTYTYTLTLNEKEAGVLKTLLGSISDRQFEEFGIIGDDREMIRELWESLQHDDDELG